MIKNLSESHIFEIILCELRLLFNCSCHGELDNNIVNKNRAVKEVLVEIGFIEEMRTI